MYRCWLEDIWLARDIIKRAKRSCLSCYSRRLLNPTQEAKENTLKHIDELKQLFAKEYERLRKTDCSYEEIQKIIANKRMCIDIKDLCERCKREIDIANRKLSTIEL